MPFPSLNLFGVKMNLFSSTGNGSRFFCTCLNTKQVHFMKTKTIQGSSILQTKHHLVWSNPFTWANVAKLYNLLPDYVISCKTTADAKYATSFLMCIATAFFLPLLPVAIYCCYSAKGEEKQK